MKALAARYLEVVKRNIPTKFTLSALDAMLWQSNCMDHAMDFLQAIPIVGLNQNLGPRQFRVVVQYRLGVPLFPVDYACPCCDQEMDIFGDHALHCANEVSVKFRYDMVRDMAVDICNKVGVAARKEVPLGFLSNNNKGLSAADILVYNWVNGQYLLQYYRRFALCR